MVKDRVDAFRIANKDIVAINILDSPFFVNAILIAFDVGIARRSCLIDSRCSRHKGEEGNQLHRERGTRLSGWFWKVDEFVRNADDGVQIMIEKKTGHKKGYETLFYIFFLHVQ